MDSLTKNIKPLTGEVDWPIWKRKIHDVLDYHENAVAVVKGKLKKPEALPDGASDAEIKEHKKNDEAFRKANSYAKSLISVTVTNDVYQKIMNTKTAAESWALLHKNFKGNAKDQVFKTCTDFFAFGWTSGEDVPI